jgi:hypothetical protein
MLINTKDLIGSKLAASDGDLGHVKDFYFDDKTWVVRYLVADTASWLTGRLVLLSPHALGRFDEVGRNLPVNLTRKQIEGSPSIEAHKSVSRQYEVEYYRYYGWPTYWDGCAMWGVGDYPVVSEQAKGAFASGLRHHHRDDKHLQSALSVKGYPIQTTDGIIGHVTGFLVNDRSWEIREMTVESGHWYSGKEILVSPGKIERISFEESIVHVSLTKEEIERTPENTIARAGALKP